MKSLLRKVKKDDHLFFYVIDHGGRTSDQKSSYICLWNGEQLLDTQFQAMITAFRMKQINVNVVLGQCNSGGFVDKLRINGCVVATASQADENSWGCTDIPYDEFVYHWTSAINGANHKDEAVASDADNDGHVTMQEAFEYAKAHDRAKEHPQYSSTPEFIGEALAFDNIPPSYDLYIKDNEEDTGKVPNLTTDKFWLSPSIWVRNFADNIYEHENPYYTPEHVAATVYVRIHNRGKGTYPGKKHYVHVYWAKASTGFRPETWLGNETYEQNGAVTGGPLTPYCIPEIPSGGYVDAVFTWALPANLVDASKEEDFDKHHFCLLARILDSPYEPWYTDTPFTYNCQNSNKEAQKNVSIINNTDLSKETLVYIRNIADETTKYTLELIPRTTSDELIYDQAAIHMTMSEPIYEAWERGGFQSNGIRKVPGVGPRTIEFESKDSKVEALSLKGKEFDKVSLKFNFRQALKIRRKYTVDLIQKNENGEIIGGESFIVETPGSSFDDYIVTSTPTQNGSYKLSTDAGPHESVRWENSRGETIGNQQSVKVKPENRCDNTYYSYILSEDGNLACSQITVEYESGIAKIHTDEQNTRLIVDLKGNPNAESSLYLSCVTTGETILKRNINESEKQVEIDISALNPGTYSVSYIENGIVIDSVKFIKQ